MTPSLEHFKALLATAETGSFSAAAESLSFTQSAISQQIAALEREVGTKLVERGPRQIALTESGRALVAHTDVILARLADDAAAGAARRHPLRGRGLCL